MALGAAQEGIDVRFAVEADPHAVATYSHNHPNARLYADDIRNLKDVDIKDGQVKVVLFGGPPCQGFSTSNQRTRNSNNPNNWLFLEFVRIVKLCKPHWVVFENVKGIVETERGTFLQNTLQDLSNYGYTTSWWILNAADFGVPQRRFRLFIIGSLDGILVEKPDPMVTNHVTVHEAIADLPDLLNGASVNCVPYKRNPISDYADMMRGGLEASSNHLVTRNAPCILERYRFIPQGGNWQDIPRNLLKNYRDPDMCHTGIYHRLREDAPSVVIANYRKNMLIHPSQDRGLSVREAARLQSFPDWYEFKGSIGFQQQQVGNAVPPLLARVVFRTILRNHRRK